MTEEVANRRELAALLRREGRHSGVWFAEDLMEAASLIDQLQRDNAALREGLERLVAKLDECAPVISNLAAVQFVRSGVGYTGPSYGEELERARSLLNPSNTGGRSTKEHN